MKFITAIAALFLAGTALAGCPNGPYVEGSKCGGDCVGAQRCSDGGTNNVIRCDGGFWKFVKHCDHCKYGAC